MKAKGIVTLGLSAAFLVACSSDENIDNKVPRGDEAFVSLSIALPTSANGTRADDDKDYNKGDAKEYNVEDLKIVYFSKPNGVNENDYDNYVVASAPQDVNKADLTWTPSTNGITTEATLPVQRVQRDVKAVLVLINPNQTLIGNITAGTKFSDLNKTLDIDQVSALTSQNDDANHFFMTNSPLSDGTTLVSVQAYNREDVARANTKAVYVERAVAKVSFEIGKLTESNGNWEVNASDPYAGDKVSFTAWSLDVTNKKEFMMRKYDTGWNSYQSTGLTINRFLATRILEPGKQRTYWATDPNYDNASMPVYTADGVVDKAQSTDFNYITESDVTTQMAAAAYCTENTFDVTHMKQGETTRVIVKAQYQPQTNMEDGLQASDFVAGQTWYRVGNSNKACNDNKLKEKVLNAVKTVTTEATAVNIVADQIAAGEHDFSKEMFTVNDASNTSTSRAMSDEELNAVKAALGKLTVYKDGICYYVARIRHFDDSQLGDWDGTDYTQNADEATRKDFLGRYGMVRNNWYQLTINSVSAPGTPTIPIPSDTPDDEQNYYLQTSVKIMDWAVRKQGLDF